MSSAARITYGAYRTTSNTGVGCNKVLAKVSCKNLISWHQNTVNDVFHARNHPLNMGEADGVKCAAKLVKKYGDQVPECKQALELLIDNRHITATDLEGLDDLKERAHQVAELPPINIDMSNGADNSIPRCKAGEVKLQFPTVTAFGHVDAADRTVGASTEVECGSKAKDPSAKVGTCLHCSTGWRTILENRFWGMPSAECDMSEVELQTHIPFTARGSGASGDAANFRDAAAKNPGITNIVETIPCTKGKLFTELFARKVIGGQVNFECTIEGEWKRKSDSCEFEDDTPTLPHGQRYVNDSPNVDVASMGPGACEAVRMRYQYSLGTPADFSVHVLDASPATTKVDRPCGKTGWTGTVTYMCKDGDWDSVDGSLPACYKPDTCFAKEHGIVFSGHWNAQVTFKLKDASLETRKELPCGSAAIEPATKLRGNAVFECKIDSNGRPNWAMTSQDCDQDSGSTRANIKKETLAEESIFSALGPGSCEQTRMSFQYAGGSDTDVSEHLLPPTANTHEVTRPCDVDGWAGEVTYVCQNGKFSSKKTPGKPACYKPDRCTANGMALQLGGSDWKAVLKFQLPETMLDEMTPEMSCADATTEKKLKGTASFKCVKGNDGRPSWGTGPTSCTAA
eukprot:CAMPEP_0169094614 /NCGR_PEP_ID=MMETSP1015-20121227/18042_1 /TAXON_ID=342587 /ORGANISM="Karlodinium micrum, Strain CCMP2283" /LENGTH=626 /DNA_ID=CAMNT_0009155289 /DNA_START=141 /DNA_END=2022 /DNA_ORIENTATION=+